MPNIKMALYIQPENQKLLWNTINKLPAFSNVPIAQREIEFKNGISIFYQKYQRTLLSKTDLQNVNQETVTYFLQRFSQQNHYLQQPQQQERKFVETKEEQYIRQFKERQQYYDQMNAKPKLPSADIFLEKETDSAITNMDELIQKYQQEREKDFGGMENLFLPQIQIQPQQQTQQTFQPIKRKLRIETNNTNLPIEAQDIDELELQQQQQQPKISWSKPLVQSQEPLVQSQENNNNHENHDDVSQPQLLPKSILKESQLQIIQRKVEQLEEKIMILESRLETLEKKT